MGVLLGLAEDCRQEVGDEKRQSGFHRRVVCRRGQGVWFDILDPVYVAVGAYVGDAHEPLEWLAHGS